jgi:hypothetical protein
MPHFTGLFFGRSQMDGRDLPCAHRDYCLNQLGIRVWESHCQLIAKSGNGWNPLGPRLTLPVAVPHTPAELAEFSGDALGVTAYQYKEVYPETDLYARLETRPTCPVKHLQTHRN